MRNAGSLDGLSRAQMNAAVAAALAAGDYQTLAEASALIAAAIDPITILELVDDFIAGGVSSGTVGSLGWTFTGGTVVSVDGEAGHPGVIRRATSATINTIARTALQQSTGAEPLLPAQSFDLTWVVRLNQTDANTEARFGLSLDWTLLAAASGIYVEKKAADTQWFGVCRNAAAESRTAALGTVDTGWHKFRIRRIDASTIGFTLDAGTELTLATNIPTAAQLPGTQLTNTAAADKTIDYDLFRMRVTGLAR